jgi:hypothetical protein
LARIVFAVALLAPLGVLTPSATAAPQKVSYEDAVPGLASPVAPMIGALSGSEGALSGSEKDVHMQQSLGCTPDTYADNPHPSSTPGVISGHGWWGQGNCSSNKATVQNCLYEYYTDGTWRRKACGTASGIYPGGGSANRSAANRGCDSTGELISWRNRVDVDVNGELDTSEVFERQADVYCVITGPDQ